VTRLYATTGRQPLRAATTLTNRVRHLPANLLRCLITSGHQSLSSSDSSRCCAGGTTLKFKAAAVAGPTMPSTFKPRASLKFSDRGLGLRAVDAVDREMPGVRLVAILEVAL
jgi:hypothetical protein